MVRSYAPLRRKGGHSAASDVIRLTGEGTDEGKHNGNYENSKTEINCTNQERQTRGVCVCVVWIRTAILLFFFED